MSAFVDSQDEENQLQSQDLFVDNINGNVVLGDNVGRQILAQLQKMDQRLQEMSEDINKLKSRSSNVAFSMQTCSFKRKLLTFLKDQFTKSPWLHHQTDMDFKIEVRRLLKKDGFSNDADAYRSVMQWSSSKYTDLRNQLRRKIIHEIKAGRNIQTITIDEFAIEFLGPFCSAKEDVTSPERIRLCLVLRSFLHKKKLMIEGSDSLECFVDFWGSFHSYYDQTINAQEEDKWEKISAIDTKRIKKHMETLEK